MAVKDKQPVTPNCTRCGVLNKVLQLSYTNFISSLAVIRYSYPPVLGVVVILALVVVLSLEDEERWDKPAASTNSSDQSYLLTVTSLAPNWIKSNL
jgi:hypothetical protein